MSTPRLATLADSMRHSWARRENRLQEDPVFSASAFSVALSRQTGARGTEVAQEVGKRLGWQVYDHDLLEQMALDIGVPAKVLEEVDERHRRWMLQVVERLMGVPYVPESVYVHRLLKVFTMLGARGKCVVVGRGCVFALPPSSTLRVRVIAPLEYRISVLRQQLRLDDAAARNKIATLDRERLRFVREHFNRDAEAPENYDLLINTGRFSICECADVIVDGLRRLQARGAPAKSAGQQRLEAASPFLGRMT